MKRLAPSGRNLSFTRSRGLLVIFATPQATLGGLQAALYRYVIGRLRQPEERHVDVDRLVSASLDQYVSWKIPTEPFEPTALLKRRQAGRCGSSGFLTNLSRFSWIKKRFTDHEGPVPGRGFRVHH